MFTVRPSCERVSRFGLPGIRTVYFPSSEENSCQLSLPQPEIRRQIPAAVRSITLFICLSLSSGGARPWSQPPGTNPRVSPSPSPAPPCETRVPGLDLLFLCSSSERHGEKKQVEGILCGGSGICRVGAPV